MLFKSGIPQSRSYFTHLILIDALYEEINVKYTETCTKVVLSRAFRRRILIS